MKVCKSVWFCSEKTTILDKFNFEIKQNELYTEHSETIDALIQEMATRPIVHVGEYLLEPVKYRSGV